MLEIMMQFILLMVAMWAIPHSRYASMDDEGGWFHPILFTIVMAMLASITMCSWQMAATDQWSWEHCLQTLIKLLLMSAGGSLLGAIVLFPIWKFLGSTRSFLVSLKSVAWVMALLPLMSILFLWFQPFGSSALISVAGAAFSFWSIIFIFWSSVLLVLASRIVHNISFPQAWVVALIAWIFFPLIIAVLSLSLWTAPVLVQDASKAASELSDASNPKENVEEKKLKENGPKSGDTNRLDSQDQNSHTVIQQDDLPEELKNLIVDNSFLPPLLNPAEKREAYYSPNSEEVGRKILGATGYRTEDGKKVVRVQIDPGDISYFYSYKAPSYKVSAGDSAAVADDAAATSSLSSEQSDNEALQPEIRQSIVTDGTISILNEAGDDIVAGVSFGQAQQYVFDEGFIYLIGEAENFGF